MWKTARRLLVEVLKSSGRTVSTMAQQSKAGLQTVVSARWQVSRFVAIYDSSSFGMLEGKATVTFKILLTSCKGRHLGQPPRH
eukprot:scaffold10099_cov149-Cylindrotheca_fusiformis.AAC.1